MEVKVCKRCGVEKPIEKFSHNKTRRDGLQDYCKVCNGEINKHWLNQHREQYRDYQAKWYKDNKDKFRAKAMAYARTPTERYRQIKRRTKIRNIGLIITKSEFVEWFNVQVYVCHYCRRELTQNKHGDLGNLTVDRRDNNKPYEASNLVLACLRCNMMKGSWLTEAQMVDASRRYFVEPLIEEE